MNLTESPWVELGYELTPGFHGMDSILLAKDIYLIHQRFVGQIDSPDVRTELTAKLLGVCEDAVRIGLLQRMKR